MRLPHTASGGVTTETHGQDVFTQTQKQINLEHLLNEQEGPDNAE